jgi:hypothetical protein
LQSTDIEVSINAIKKWDTLTQLFVAEFMNLRTSLKHPILVEVKKERKRTEV